MVCDWQPSCAISYFPIMVPTDTLYTLSIVTAERWGKETLCWQKSKKRIKELVIFPAWWLSNHQDTFPLLNNKKEMRICNVYWYFLCLARSTLLLQLWCEKSLHAGWLYSIGTLMSIKKESQKDLTSNWLPTAPSLYYSTKKRKTRICMNSMGFFFCAWYQVSC